MLEPFTRRLLENIARGKKLRRDQYTHLADAGYIETHDDGTTYVVTTQGTAALNQHH